MAVNTGNAQVKKIELEFLAGTSIQAAFLEARTIAINENCANVTFVFNDLDMTVDLFKTLAQQIDDWNVALAKGPPKVLGRIDGTAGRVTRVEDTLQKLLELIINNKRHMGATHFHDRIPCRSGGDGIWTSCSIQDLLDGLKGG